MIKPISYSVVKHGVIGLTKYLATYWAEQKIRVNALAPGGILASQTDEFLKRITALIPMARLADHDEYKGTIVYLASDASYYMTGTTLIVDGGRTSW